MIPDEFMYSDLPAWYARTIAEMPDATWEHFRVEAYRWIFAFYFEPMDYYLIDRDGRVHRGLLV